MLPSFSLDSKVLWFSINNVCAVWNFMGFFKPWPDLLLPREEGYLVDCSAMPWINNYSYRYAVLYEYYFCVKSDTCRNLSDQIYVLIWSTSENVWVQLLIILFYYILQRTWFAVLNYLWWHWRLRCLLGGSMFGRCWRSTLSYPF